MRCEFALHAKSTLGGRHEVNEAMSSRTGKHCLLAFYASLGQIRTVNAAAPIDSMRTACASRAAIDKYATPLCCLSHIRV